MQDVHCTIAGRRPNRVNPIALVAVIMNLISCAKDHAVILPTQAPQPLQARHHTGVAKYYGMGLMQDVARFRGLDMGSTTGFATYPDCERIGEVIWVSVFNPITEEWSEWDNKVIVDCSQPKDYARHKKEGLVELSYEDAGKYGYLTEGRTKIKYYLEKGDH
jgi:hypothetical protein